MQRVAWQYTAGDLEGCGFAIIRISSPTASDRTRAARHPKIWGCLLVKSDTVGYHNLDTE